MILVPCTLYLIPYTLYFTYLADAQADFTSTTFASSTASSTCLAFGGGILADDVDLGLSGVSIGTCSATAGAMNAWGGGMQLQGSAGSANISGSGLAVSDCTATTTSGSAYGGDTSTSHHVHHRGSCQPWGASATRAVTSVHTV